MKGIFGFMAISFIMLLATCTPGQSKSNYRVFWDADASGKTASWNVYLEQLPADTGFVLQPGVNRKNTDLTQPGIIRIMNIPAGTTEAVFELNNNNEYLMAGVEAMSAGGIYTDLGLNSAPYQLGDSPPVPSNVGIERVIE